MEWFFRSLIITFCNLCSQASQSPQQLFSTFVVTSPLRQSLVKPTSSITSPQLIPEVTTSTLEVSPTPSPANSTMDPPKDEDDGISVWIIILIVLGVILLFAVIFIIRFLVRIYKPPPSRKVTMKGSYDISHKLDGKPKMANMYDESININDNEPSPRKKSLKFGRYVFDNNFGNEDDKIGSKPKREIKTNSIYEERWKEDENKDEKEEIIEPSADMNGNIFNGTCLNDAVNEVVSGDKEVSNESREYIRKGDSEETAVG